ncbi:MAG: carboxypeptidase-like regulatory domain-containing protein [Rudaea sp.]
MRSAMFLAFVLLAINAALAASGKSEYATSPPSRREMLAAKSGTVVDGQSGAGIADATVIAVWDMHSTGWERDSGGCVVRRIVHTDATGHFDLPDVSAEHWFHPPHASVAERIHALAGNVEFSWRLAVFKPGYLRMGDSETLAKDTEQNPTFLDWEWKSPRSFATRDGYRVVPIRLVKDNLRPQDEISYLATLRKFATCTTNPPMLASPAFDGLNREINNIAKSLPCRIPEHETVRAGIAMEYTRLIAGQDTKQFFARMNTQMHNRWPWTDTTAGMLCWASGGRETRP